MLFTGCKQTAFYSVLGPSNFFTSIVFFFFFVQVHIIPTTVCVLLFQCFRALCCKGPPPPRPEYDVVCIGLTGAGKTSLLSRLCNEGSDGIVPTTGTNLVEHFSLQVVVAQ